MKLYKNEKIIFEKIQNCFQNKIFLNNINEFKKIIKYLYLTYNPAINENKFIVGHVVEKLFTLLLRSFDFTATQEGSNKIGYDLLINNFKFSLKTSSNPKTNIRIKNFHRTTTKTELNIKNNILKYSTILIQLGTGIVYFDPYDLKQNNLLLKKHTDGCDIEWKNINSIINKNNSLIKLEEFPSKKEMYKNKIINCRTASNDVCDWLLKEYSEILVKYLVK